ncbi:transmembrane protein 223-like [Acanthaster planci]|uniref:Transmembrane protein 223-like n=1 Tax=Acanthaster planci TaxID=133434 RepID=A0A8B8A420_ACAPL|nr:transmembrane protein 223-like [Acanthaster planci]
MLLGRAAAAGAYKLLSLSPGSVCCVQVNTKAMLAGRLNQPMLWCWGRALGREKGQCLSVRFRQVSNYSKTHIDKNILIYRNDGFTFFRLVGLFAVAQLGFWSYLTYSAFTSMTDSRNFELVKYGPEGAPPEEKNWTSLSGIRMKLHSGVWRYALTMLCFAVGGLICFGALTYSKKCIHRIVLRKGGDRVTISTFGFFGQPWSFTVPIANVSCRHSRHGVRTQLPIKVKGHSFFYLLDKEGKLYNAPLFDQTVGMRRMLLS